MRQGRKSTEWCDNGHRTKNKHINTVNFFPICICGCQLLLLVCAQCSPDNTTLCWKWSFSLVLLLPLHGHWGCQGLVHHPSWYSLSSPSSHIFIFILCYYYYSTFSIIMNYNIRYIIEKTGGGRRTPNANLYIWPEVRPKSYPETYSINTAKKLLDPPGLITQCEVQHKISHAEHGDAVFCDTSTSGLC